MLLDLESMVGGSTNVKTQEAWGMQLDRKHNGLVLFLSPINVVPADLLEPIWQQLN